MTPEIKENKVIPYQNRKNINIGIIIFGIIFIYLVATIIMYLTAPHVTVYEVRQGSILKDNAYTGLAIREEHVIYSDETGYANYYVENNSKIRVGAKIYTISDEKLDFKQTASENDIVLNTKEMDSILLKIQSYNDQFVEDSFSDTYQLKDELTGVLDKYVNQSKTKQLEEMLEQGNRSDLSVKSATRDGIVVYSVDGMEDLTIDDITSKQLKKEKYKRTEFSNNRKVKEGEPVYKVVTNDKWSLLVEVSEDTKEALQEKKTVKVNFKKDSQALRAQLTFLEDTEKPVACLTFQHSMIRYVNDRYLDIELVLEDETGLKIPKTAETSKQFYTVPKSYLTQGGNSNSDGVLLQTTNKEGNSITQFLPVTVYYEEDETIYLDPNAFEKNPVILRPDSTETMKLNKKKSLKGVYCINKGYAVFKQIQILCESDEYYIIEEGNSFGLSNYDHIALDSKSIAENDVVF